MILSQDSLQELFSVVNTGDPSGTCYFNFVSNCSQNLVVTVGDSWTWGLDMTSNNDNQYRLNNNYGQIIANELRADWLNLAQCGSGNTWMATKVQEFCNIASYLDYKKIYLFVTYSEMGRAIQAETLFDFEEFLKHQPINKLLAALDNEATHKIQTVTTDNRITLRIGRNFVDHPDSDSIGILPTPWYKLLDAECNDTCHVVSSWALDEVRNIDFVPYHLHNEFLEYCIELTAAAAKRREVLSNLPLLCKSHPLAEAHQRWAKYLLENI